MNAKHTGWGRGGERSEPNKERVFLGPHPYPVKSSVLHCRPILSGFYAFSDRIKIRENRLRDCEQSKCYIMAVLFVSGKKNELVYLLLPLYRYLHRMALNSATLVSFFKIVDL